MFPLSLGTEKTHSLNQENNYFPKKTSLCLIEILECIYMSWQFAFAVFSPR